MIIPLHFILHVLLQIHAPPILVGILLNALGFLMDTPVNVSQGTRAITVKQVYQNKLHIKNEKLKITIRNDKVKKYTESLQLRLLSRTRL